jgi:hypothetical protein
MVVTPTTVIPCGRPRHRGQQRPPATVVVIYPGGELSARCADCFTRFLNVYAAADPDGRTLFGIYRLPADDDANHLQAPTGLDPTTIRSRSRSGNSDDEGPVVEPLDVSSALGPQAGRVQHAFADR